MKGGEAPLADEGLKLAAIDQKDLHTSIVVGVARGLREGVHAHLLDGYAAHSSMEHLVFVNERDGRLLRLRKDSDRARTLADRARRAAVEEEDESVASAYREDARRHTARHNKLEQDINRLKAAFEHEEVPLKFTGEVDYLIQGVSALLASDAKMSREQRAAWRTVMHDFSITLDGDLVQWQLHLRVPVSGRVVVLGPFTGTLEQRGRVVTPAEFQLAATSTGSRHQRRPAIEALMNAGYPRPLARAASIAANPLLVDVLLGREVIWPDCPPDFDHSNFSAHVRSTWEAHPGWTPGTYSHTSPKRQALADLVAGLGGQASVEDLDGLLHDHGLKRIDIYSLSIDRSPTHASKTTPPWPATVTRIGNWSKGSPSSASRLSSLMCPRCGQPCTGVVRVPEVPDAMLCRKCLVLPSRPDLSFPPLYLHFALPSRRKR